MPESSEDNRARTAQQIEIHNHRVRIMRRAITFSAASVFFVSVLMLALFVGALMHMDWALLVTALFAGALLCLTVGLALFIYDFQLSLTALDLELGRKRPEV
jgi:phosphoglycerol transferase MdoB-like AlkP superfamily enzyme